MVQRIRLQVSIGFIGLAIASSLAAMPRATAQMSQSDRGLNQADSTPLLAQSSPMNMQGRGVAQGSAFTRGRTANAVLTIDGNNFGLELAEPPGTRARVQYRGSIIRRNRGAGDSNSFTLDGRVQSFNSTENLRLRGVTTGTCRIEVFDARVISSTCNTVATNSNTRFLGLEQF